MKLRGLSASVPLLQTQENGHEETYWPAKIEILGATAEATIGALLFNFDFDDAAVKPEHQAWLNEHAVPSLKATKQRVFLRGIASQKGDRQYNLDLSQRRVQAVSNFLIEQGVTVQQVVTTFTGEDLSTSLLADDERDRAVEAIFEVSAGPMRFERVDPTESKDGFDEFSDPPTLVVPQQASRLIRLLGGAVAVVQSLNRGVVRPVDPLNPGADPVVATSDDFLLRLEPGVAGPAQLVAHFPQASVDQPVLGIVGVPKPQVPPRRIGVQKVPRAVICAHLSAANGVDRVSLREDGPPRRGRTRRRPDRETQ